jgi:NADPH:quinone reductase
MRALLCTEFGGPDRLVLGDVPTPGVPGSGELLIEVGAAGLNFADLLMIGGQYQEKPPLPFVPVWKSLESCAAVARASRA